MSFTDSNGIFALFTHWKLDCKKRLFLASKTEAKAKSNNDAVLITYCQKVEIAEDGW